MYTLVFHSEYKTNNVVVNTLQYDRLITLDNFENLLISISKMFFFLTNQCIRSTVVNIDNIFTKKYIL